MLIPRGNEIGLDCDLFVMISNDELIHEDDSLPENSTGSCSEKSFSFCGMRNKKYPDKRAMGFPFDRRFNEEHELLILPNMKTVTCKIYHKDEVEP